MNGDNDGMIFASFVLGLKVAENISGFVEMPSDKLVKLLESIANGDETLVPSGADLRLMGPDLEDLEACRTANQRDHQTIARMVISKLKQQGYAD